MSVSPMAVPMPSRLGWARRNAAIALGTLARPTRGRRGDNSRAFAHVAIGIAISVGVILLMMLFVDAAAMRAVRQAPAWLVDTFQVITKFGLSGWFLFPLGFALIAMAFINAPPLTRISQLVLIALSLRLGFLFSAIALPGLVVAIVKRIIGRARPGVAGEDVFFYKFFVWRPEYASFPSGHATTACAVAVAFGILWPRWRPLLWIYAALIMLSRIIVHAHHPSDVVAGALAGAIGAVLVRDWMAARRLAFAVHSDGRIEPFGGPSLARIKRVAHRLAAP